MLYFLCIYIYYQTKKQKPKNKDHICSVLITIWHIYIYWEVNFEVKMGILSICQMDTWHIYIYINLYMCLGKNLFKGVCKRFLSPGPKIEDWRLGKNFFNPESWIEDSWVQEVFLRPSIFNPGLKNFFSGPQSAIFDQKQNQLIPMFREGHPLHEKSLNFRSFPSAVNYFTTKDDQTCFFFSRSNSSRQAQALQTNTFIQKV